MEGTTELKELPNMEAAEQAGGMVGTSARQVYRMKKIAREAPAGRQRTDAIGKSPVQCPHVQGA